MQVNAAPDPMGRAVFREGHFRDLVVKPKLCTVGMGELAGVGVDVGWENAGTGCSKDLGPCDQLLKTILSCAEVELRKTQTSVSQPMPFPGQAFWWWQQ